MTETSRDGRGPAVLCLIDGTALAYRSYYAFVRRPLLNSRGENVSAVYGFASTVIRLLNERAPSHVAIAFDTCEPTFRHEAFEDYKATREEMPDDMAGQLPSIHEFAESCGIAVLERPGYEADDLIGTLAVRARDAGMRAVIVSGDKDFFQLVGDRVAVLDPAKDIEYTPELVEEKFGVPPEQVIDVLGLMGDSSDNVPGVPGIGRKTAVDLVRQYGNIEGVLEHIDEIGGPKRRENLRASHEQALESRALVTIELAAPVDVELEDLAAPSLGSSGAADFLRENEFPSLLKLVVPEGGPAGADYVTVDDAGELERLVEELRGSGGFAVDLETSSLDPMTADIVGVALSFEEESAYYVPVGHTGGGGLGPGDVLEALRPVLESPDIPKLGQNVKFDLEVLSAAGVGMAPLGFDTMVASYLLDPGRRQHGLSALALEHLNVRMTPIEELIGKGSGQLSFADVDVDVARDYACADADIAFRLTRLLSERIDGSGLRPLMEKVELPLIPVLARMEQRGVSLDTGFLAGLDETFCREIDRLRGEVCRLAGVEFNIDSPKQVGNVLFEKLELPRGRRTKTGYSTDTRVLESLRDVHEVPALILEYRQLRKLKTGYLDALPKLVNEKTGRVHTSFNQTVAATGRLSSSNPNLQNIPVRTELGREIRRAFVAGGGTTLLSADYSQIELRIMAHLSGDPGLAGAFERGEDVHRTTASLIFGVPEGEVTAEQRDWAKTVNFGIMYGMGRFGLAGRLGIDVDEAAGFIDRYFETYPGVAEYTERAISDALEAGHATTMLGRTRPISGLDSDNARVRGMAERVAVNTPIQGSAADMIKLAMIAIDRRIWEEGLPCSMVLQVHDELVFEVEESAVDEVAAVVIGEMERTEGMALDVPVVANAAHGPNWLEAHP
jgi:DNA polymerase-1